MLEVRLTGKFDIQFDGKPVVLSSRAAQSLFAFLILTAGTLHRREKLAGMLWPEESEQKARTYLRNELWRIRKALSQASTAEYLLTDNLTVGFDPSSPYWLDLAGLRQLGDTNSVEELIPALSNYQGELLPGFYDDWLVLERERLQVLFEQKIACLLEMLEKEQRWQDSLRWAERWIASAQAPEAAYRALMVAYDARGDHARVASTYERCKQALRQLDLEPSEETRALARKRSSKINVPIPLTSFIGREKEIKEVAALVSRSRLVTLTGSGGVGKTRLAIQVVAEVMDLFPDGVWFLDLAPLNDPALVPGTLASLLGLRESAEISITELLIDYFRSRTALVILDNCEHLIGACARLAHSLLTSCEHLHILAASREALRVSGEFPYRVPSLAMPGLDLTSAIDQLSGTESVRLFVERAAVARPGFSLDSQNGPLIAQICRRLDGIPLAIELAAARTDMLSCQQILTRLDDRFHLLTGGVHSGLPRHQTLRAMIQWSYDLLSGREQQLFHRLSVFAGGWSLDSAEQVCAGNDMEAGQILDLLTRLLNKSLIGVERAQGKEARYQMLETIRQYAEEQALASGERDLLRDRHLTYFVEMAEQADERLHSPDMIMWLDRLEADLDNLRAALARGLESDIESMLRLAGALAKFWHTRGFTLEGIKWLEQGLSAEQAAEGNRPSMSSRSLIRGKALIAYLTLLTRLPDVEKAKLCYDESLSLFQALGPEGREGMAWTLLLGAIYNLTDEAYVTSLEKSLALFYETGDKLGISECFIQLAEQAEFEENYEKASALVEQHLALRREMGDQDGIGAALLKLAIYSFLWKDEYGQGVTLFEESLRSFRSIRKKSGISWVLAHYGEVCLWYGDHARAARNFEEGRHLAQEVGEKDLYSMNCFGLGITNWFHGDYVGAIEMIKTSMALFNEVWQRRGVIWIDHVLGDIALAQADEQTAAQWYEEEMTLSEEQQEPMGKVIALCGLGKVAWVKGDYDLATKRFQDSLMILPEKAPDLAKFHALYGLGRVAQSRGDDVTARAYYGEALGIYRQGTPNRFRWTSIRTFKAVVAYPVDALAILATAQDQLEHAACLFGAVDAIYPALRYEMPAVERAEHDQAVVTVRAALGEEEFAAAWKKGQAMTVDEAIAYSLEE